MSLSEVSIIKCVRSLRGDVRYSDLIIGCGDKKYHVHKAILCPQSRYFEVACKPGTFKEGLENEIHIPECATVDELQDGHLPEAINAMIDFCYGKPNYETLEDDNGQPLKWLAVLYITADRFQIQKMKEDVVSMVKDKLKLFPKVRRSTKDVKNKEMPSEIPGFIAILYQNLPDSDKALKRELLRWLLGESPLLLYCTAIDDLIAKYHGFAADLVPLLRAWACALPAGDERDLLPAK